MTKKKGAGPIRPCPHCSKPVHPRRKTCPHCHEVIQTPAKRAAPPENKAAGQLRAEDAELVEDDWIDRLLPTYD